MDVKDVTELLVRYVALPEDVMVLEEFKETNSVFLNLVLDLEHQGVVVGVVSCEVGPLLDVSGFELGGRSEDGVFEAVGILEEFGVTDFVLFVTVDGLDQRNLFSVEGESEECERLLELLS